MVFSIELRNNEIVVNESSPSKLFILRKNDDFREAKKICDHSDFHLAMFINGKITIKKIYLKKCIQHVLFQRSSVIFIKNSAVAY